MKAPTFDELFGPVWRPSLPDNFVVIDCESSGLDREAASVLSIAAVRTDGETFYVEPCPMTDYCEEKAMEVNGFDWEECQARTLTFREAWRALRRWLGPGKFIFAGKNPTYDWDILTNNILRIQSPDSPPPLKDKFSRRVIDLHQWAYAWGLMRGIDISHEDFNSQLIYSFLKLEKEPLPHNALTGAKLEMEAFRKFLHA